MCQNYLWKYDIPKQVSLAETVEAFSSNLVVLNSVETDNNNISNQKQIGVFFIVVWVLLRNLRGHSVLDILQRLIVDHLIENSWRAQSSILLTTTTGGARTSLHAVALLKDDPRTTHSSAFSLPLIPWCPGTHTNFTWWEPIRVNNLM